MRTRNIFLSAGAGLLIFFALISAKDSKLTQIKDLPLFGSEVFEVGDEKTYLYDVKEGMSYGMASRAYSGGAFIQIISADLSGGQIGQYKVWLIDPATSQRIEAGPLVRIDGEYISVYQSEKDLRSFSQILIGPGLEDPLLVGAY